MAHTLRSETKATMILAGPVVLTQLGQMSLGFIDTLMVGRLGADSLAGIALGNTTFFFTMIFGMGTLLAIQPIVAQAFGAGNTDGIGRTFRQGLWLALALTVVFTFVLVNMAVPLRWLGQDPANIAAASSYLKAMAFGVFPFLGFFVLRGFIEGVSQPRAVTVVALSAVFLNIGANYVLMFGKFGFPALGLVGTGYASSIVYWFNFLVLLIYIQTQRRFKPYALLANLRRPDPHAFAEIFRIGWPIGISLGIEHGLFMFSAMMMGWIGTTALAAHQMALMCAAYTFMVPLGIAIATTVRVGQAVGRGDEAGVRWAGYIGVGLATLFMLGAAVLFWTAPRAVISLFLDINDPANTDVVTLAVRLLGVAAVFQVVDGIQVAAGGALRGLKDTRVPMVIGFVSYLLIGLTAGYLLAFKAGFAAQGLWWGFVLGLGTAAVLLTLRCRRSTYRVLADASS